MGIKEILIDAVKGVGIGLWKSLDRNGQFIASLAVAGIKPIIRSKQLDLKAKVGMFDVDIPDHQWEVTVSFDEKGEPTKVIREDGVDVTTEVGKLPIFTEFAGTDKVMILEARVTHESAAKKVLVAGAKAMLPSLRPWSFKDKELKEELKDPQYVLQAKENGVLVETHFDKEGKLTKCVSARGGKVDLRNGLPGLRDAIVPDSLRDSVIISEVTHPKGLHFVSGLLHATKENAEAVIRKDGHPKSAVLFVRRFAGAEVGHQKYVEARALCEKVAGKLPHGYVPDECAGTEVEKRSFMDRIARANRVLEIPRQDGVVAYPKEQPMSGAKLLRDKPPQSHRVVIMGFDKSARIPGAAAAFQYGDGIKVLGNVNIADPNMRVAVFQNPDRYKGKVAIVEGTHRSEKTGAIFTPVLRQILWEEKPEAVKAWDPKAVLRQRVSGMEPDPAKQLTLMDKLRLSRQAVA
jgi:hypothetical protein